MAWSTQDLIELIKDYGVEINPEWDYGDLSFIAEDLVRREAEGEEFDYPSTSTE